MRILVVGSRGNFGKLAAELFERDGHKVTGIGRLERDTVNISDYDVTVLSIPVAEMGSYIENNSGSIIVEVSSVKAPLKKYAGMVVSIHPMFGPRSVDDPQFHNIIYVDDVSIKDGERIVKELFQGFRLFHMTSEGHDKAMIDMLIKPYLMARLATEISNVSTPFLGPSQSILQKLSSISVSERSEILEQNMKLNPYAKDAMREIWEAAKRITEDF